MISDNLQGKAVLVTGASAGIGRATAQLLSEAGARIVAVGRDAERLAKLKTELGGEGHLFVASDLAEISDFAAWMRDIVAQTGPLSGIVHSAGIVFPTPLRVLRQEDLRRTMLINLEVPIFLTKAFRQKGNRTEPASVVFISSVAALKGQPSLTAYAASKGALISVTRTLAAELAREQIRVNCICPGLVETEMAAQTRSILPSGNFDEIAKAYPLGFGRPEDVAHAAAFLLSDRSRWTTGTVQVLDGGYLA